MTDHLVRDRDGGWLLQRTANSNTGSKAARRRPTPISTTRRRERLERGVPRSSRPSPIGQTWPLRERRAPARSSPSSPAAAPRSARRACRGDGRREEADADQRVDGVALADRHRQRGRPVGLGARDRGRIAVAAHLVEQRAELAVRPRRRNRAPGSARSRRRWRSRSSAGAEGEIGAAHRRRQQVGPQPEHRIGVRPGADRAGPELDRDRIAVDDADADRPFEAMRSGRSPTAAPPR